MRKLVLHEKFHRQLGVEALGKKDGIVDFVPKKYLLTSTLDILLQNLPLAHLEAPVDLVKTYSVQTKNQDNILAEENKGGYFS